MRSQADRLGSAMGTLGEPVPVGIVAFWAMIGVVLAVILIRLRDDDFGVKVGASLFAIGVAALVLFCASMRVHDPHPNPPAGRWEARR